MWRKVRRMYSICSKVSIGWTVIAGSVVVSGNTIHWLEKQGSCEDSFLNNSVSKLYSSTVELGGIVVNSSNDLIKYFSKTYANFRDKKISTPFKIQCSIVRHSNVT